MTREVKKTRQSTSHESPAIHSSGEKGDSHRQSPTRVGAQPMAWCVWEHNLFINFVKSLLPNIEPKMESLF